MVFLLFEPRVYPKQPLYLTSHKGRGKICYILPSSDSTCGITLGMLLSMVFLNVGPVAVCSRRETRCFGMR
uniref:Putative ovule protein n=1 Tax=Solanum chacoense TaxID=4108 RepID=A0A0V0H573_SOLCH